MGDRVKAKDVLIFGAVGIGLYYLWKAVSGVSNAVSCGLKQVGCAICSATCAATTSAANSIVSWTTCSAISLSGNVVFPNGSQVALKSLQVGHDCSGNVYVQYQGGVYQLYGSNSCGNWPATQIS
jgi:hypothetical protein